MFRLLHYNTRQSRSPAITFALLLVVVACASAQQPLSIGPSIGYSYGVPLTVDRTPGLVNRYDSDRPGLSSDHAAWFGIAFDAPQLLGDLGIAAELGLALSAGNFTSDPFLFDSLFDATTLQRVRPQYQFEVTTALSALQLDIEARYEVSENWVVGIGPWLQYRLSSGLFQIERLLDHPGVTFSDGTREHAVVAGEAIGADRLRYGLVASAGLRIPLNDGLDLLPSLNARIDAGAMIVDGIELQRASRFGAGVAVLFDLDRFVASPPAPVDTPRIAAMPKPSAAIRLFSTSNGTRDTATAIIHDNNVHHRQVAPLLPVVFFDENASDLPTRYVQLSRSQADGFAERDLAGLDPVVLHRQVLNVIGMRLHRESSTRITVYGSNAVGETREIARRRAESVREYLYERWGVERLRVDVQLLQNSIAFQGDQFNRCVLISSTAAWVTGPVYTEWRVERLDAPPLGMEHRIEATAGLRGWRLRIAHNEQTVAQYSGVRSDEIDGIDMALAISADETRKDLGAITAELAVEDSAGTIIMARDSLLLSRSSDNSGSMREDLVLLAEPFASVIAGSADVDMLRSIVSMVDSGASITILGPSRNHKTLARPDVIAHTLLSWLQEERGIPLNELHAVDHRDVPTPTTPEEDVLDSWVQIVVRQPDVERKVSEP